VPPVGQPDRSPGLMDRQYLPPRVLQLFGVLLLVAFAAFWAITGRESVVLVGAAMSLILLGAYGSAQHALKDLSHGPTPPPIAPAPLDPPDAGGRTVQEGTAGA
jgi:disulfide bond formation protein DsbB